MNKTSFIIISFPKDAGNLKLYYINNYLYIRQNIKSYAKAKFDNISDYKVFKTYKLIKLCRKSLW